MKQEDNYIDYLFESAREEAPQHSFEEVAEVFSASTSPTLLGLAKGWFFKNINLNSFFILSATTLGFIAIFLFSSSNKNTSAEGQIVTKQIKKSSSIKNHPLDIEEKSTDILLAKTPTISTVKKIKKTTTLLKSKTEFQKFNKILISESPILYSISPELKLETPLNISLASSLNHIEKEKSNSDYQTEYETTEETLSPWVIGEKSEMPWKIKRQTRTPILNETERVLQQFMNTKYLEQIFEKEETGYFKPLKMLVHYSLNENYFVHFKGEKIRLINEEISPDFDLNDPFIDLKKFKIKKTKAYFNFTYKDHHVQMQLRKVGEGWKRHKLKVKKNKDVLVNMTF
ncbi:MAG: hypothetical protein AB8F94_19235 [Saprospiraceae bacterium]